MTEPAPVNLHFEDSGKWYSLPDWAEYFIEIGREIVATPHSQSRVVTAIIVPTRAFGAAFVSLGMVIADAAPKDAASESEHFQRLFDLPPGTPVIYRRKKGGAQRGILQRPEDYDGQLWIRVQVNSSEGGSTTHLIDEANSLRVQPAGGKARKLPKKQGLFNKRTINEFVDGLIGETDPVQLGLRSKIVCALVGKRNSLEHEIRRTPLALHINGNAHVKGQLQDVLRVDRFVASEQSHRSALISVGTDLPPSPDKDAVETAVVFDGALGFLKWGTEWPGRHQVIILDRTERHFDDAVSAINTRFSQNRLQEGAVNVRAEPAGGEVLAFREAAK